MRQKNVSKNASNNNSYTAFCPNLPYIAHQLAAILYHLFVAFQLNSSEHARGPSLPAVAENYHRLYVVLCFVAIGAVQLSNSRCVHYCTVRGPPPKLTDASHEQKKHSSSQIHTRRCTNEYQSCTPQQRSVSGCRSCFVLSRLWGIVFKPLLRVHCCEPLVRRKKY